MKKIAIIALSILAFGMLSPSFTMGAYAQTPALESLKEEVFSVGNILSLDDEEGKPQGQEWLKSDSPIVAFILTVINFALQIMGSIAIIILIIGGFMFMLAQGNQQKLDEAKDVIKYAIIGLLVAFLAYIIVIFVQSLFVPSKVAEPTSFIETIIEKIA